MTLCGLAAARLAAPEGAAGSGGAARQVPHGPEWRQRRLASSEGRRCVPADGWPRPSRIASVRFFEIKTRRLGGFHIKPRVKSE
jgi:hypothetical protein